MSFMFSFEKRTASLRRAAPQAWPWPWIPRSELSGVRQMAAAFVCVILPRLVHRDDVRAADREGDAAPPSSVTPCCLRAATLEDEFILCLC